MEGRPLGRQACFGGGSASWTTGLPRTWSRGSATLHGGTRGSATLHGRTCGSAIIHVSGHELEGGPLDDRGHRSIESDATCIVRALFITTERCALARCRFSSLPCVQRIDARFLRTIAFTKCCSRAGVKPTGGWSDGTSSCLTTCTCFAHQLLTGRPRLQSGSDIGRAFQHVSFQLTFQGQSGKRSTGTAWSERTSPMVRSGDTSWTTRCEQGSLNPQRIGPFQAR